MQVESAEMVPDPNLQNPKTQPEKQRTFQEEKPDGAQQAVMPNFIKKKTHNREQGVKFDPVSVIDN